MLCCFLLVQSMSCRVSRRCIHWFLILWLPVSGFASPIDDEGDLYIVDVISYGYRLGEGLPIYVYHDMDYIQFELLMEFLEFPIVEDEGVWSGWFIKEDNHFSLGVDDQQVSFPNHKDIELASELVFDSEDGLVVNRTALQDWFGLELEVDLRQQVVKVRSQEALPFQQQLAQEAKLNRGTGYLEPEEGKVVLDQYQWFTEPQVDFSSTADYFDNGISAGNSLFMSLNASLDLLKHGMQYSGSVSRNQIRQTFVDDDNQSAPIQPSTSSQLTNSNHSLTFFRRAPSKHGEIAMGVDFYEFGDIFGTSNLVTSGGSGLGLNLGRNQKNSQAALGKTNISGVAPANWLAELYRDGVLLDIGRVDVDGQYRFPDKDLNFGQNLFLVKLEGPQGEIIEHRYPVWGGGSDLAAGEHNFDVLVIDHRKQVFDELQGDHTSLPATRTFDTTFDVGLANKAQLGIGFTQVERFLRLEADSDSVPSNDDTTAPEFELRQDNYITLSGQKNVGLGTLTVDNVQQQAGGSTWKLRFLGKYWGHNLYFDHQIFNDFDSPANRGKENITDLSEFKFESPLSWRGLNHYSIGITHKSFKDDRENYEVRSRIGGHWDNMDLNNELIVQRNDRTVNFQGRLRFSTRLLGSGIRGELTYAPGANDLWQRFAVDWTYRINQRLSNNLKVIKALKNDKELSVNNRLTWRFPSVDVGFNLSWNDNNYTVGLNVNTAFGFDRHQKQFFRSRTGLSNTGKVALQLFVDSNNNGVLDSEEETLEDVYFRNEDLISGDAGGLLLHRVPEKNTVDINTDDLVFDDGYLVPVEPRYSVFTHAGSTVELPIPVVMTGDVEGMVYRLDNSGRKTRRGKMGVQLELVSENGSIVKTTRSQYDGYYSFVEVPIGRYQLRVVGKYEDPALSWAIELDDEEGYVEVDDFHVY